MRTALGTLFILGMAGVPVTADQVLPPPSKPAQGKLWAGICVSRPIYQPDTWTVDRFTMHLALVNDSDQVIETEARDSVLVVNGKPMEDHGWRAPMRGGSATRGWDKLAPGESTTNAFLLEEFFAESGVYRVS